MAEPTVKVILNLHEPTDISLYSVNPSRTELSVNSPISATSKYFFHSILNNSSTEQVFDFACKGLLQKAAQGKDCSYLSHSRGAAVGEELAGICLDWVFRERATVGVSLSICEIHQNVLRDLGHGYAQSKGDIEGTDMNGLNIIEFQGKILVEGLVEVKIQSKDEGLAAIGQGKALSLNSENCHVIYTLKLTMKNQTTGTLNIVELASGASHPLITQSLETLSKMLVSQQLEESISHGNSKLTMYLSQYLHKNSHTLLMISTNITNQTVKMALTDLSYGTRSISQTHQPGILHSST